MAEEQAAETPTPKEGAQEVLDPVDSLMDLVAAPAEVQDTYREGIEALIAHIGQMEKRPEKISIATVDEMLADLDETMSSQINEILHNEQFQKMESSWRSLWFLVDRTSFRENIQIDIFNCSKADLLADFQDSPDWEKSGLYRQVYVEDYNTHGGKPLGCLVGNYEFGYGPQDISLLQEVARVSAVAKAPFLAATAPEMFGVESFTKIDQVRDMYAVFDGPQYTKWNSFRESDDARYVGLAMPRFLLRLPYGKDTDEVKDFAFQEDSVVEDHEKYMWGNAAFALASRLTDSFAKFRWYTHVIGPQSGGAVEDLPLHQYPSLGKIQTKIPTETLIDEARDKELCDYGFIPLVMRKESDNAAFFEAQSAKKPKTFPDTTEGRASATNDKLGLALPYLFITCRLAHYLKVIQRENIGKLTSKMAIQNELNTWIRQYVNNTETPSLATTGRTPLKEAEIIVEDVEGDPGVYRVSCKMVPHFRLKQMWVTLSMVGKLEPPVG